MATLEITNKTIKVVGVPKPVDDSWWVHLLRSFFKKPDDPRKQSVRSYPLTGMESAEMDPHETPWTLQWLMTQGLKPRDYWTLSLKLRNSSTRVIASRDYSAIKSAHDQVHAALNAPDKFFANVTIENSTLVIDSYVRGNVETKVSEGEVATQDH